MATCGLCSRYASLVDFHFRCSKRGNKFCKIGDITHIELLHEAKGQRLSPKDIESSDHATKRNEADISVDISSGAIQFPNSSESFQAALKSLHKRYFDGAGINRSGRFRIPGEDVQVDRGRNKFEGRSPSQFNSDFSFVWSQLSQRMILLEKRSSKEDLAMIIAWFLIVFFAIHPFNVGNGRIARLFCKLLARNFGYSFYLFEGRASLTEPKLAKKYKLALRYAHRRRTELVIHDRHLEFLAYHCGKFLRPLPGDEEIEPMGHGG